MAAEAHGNRCLALVTLVVPDYAPALDFYVGVMGFELIADIDQGDKRWVVVAPRGGVGISGGAQILLARASGPAQEAAVGNQTGGRVGFFLHTDDFERDHAAMQAAGVRFLEPPRHEAYGSVVQWADPFGNLWDLLQPA